MRARKVSGLAAALVLAFLGAAQPSHAQPAQPEPGGEADTEAPSPHARAGGSTAPPGVFEPPADTEDPDPSSPPGTILVDLRDADDHPVAGELVSLGTMINSIAKGESRRHTQGVTDARGRVVFSGLETVSDAAYRVSTGHEGGSFAAMPFRLDQAKAMHVVLHVYSVTRDLSEATVVVEATVAGEVRDDRIALEEVLNFYNLGRTAWQPDDVRMLLPPGHTAFNAQMAMSDQGVDESEGGAKLRGTFPPGRSSLQFQWQLPWSGDKDVDFEVGLPPHVAIARVVMPVASGIQLGVEGFPAAEIRHDSRGQRFLVAEKRLRQNDAKLLTLAIGLHGLPTPGSARIVATVVAALGVLFGLWLTFARRPGVKPVGGRKAARSELLEELAGLERARVAGEVGPKTYERVRRELLEALARTLAPA